MKKEEEEIRRKIKISLLKFVNYLTAALIVKKYSSV